MSLFAFFSNEQSPLIRDALEAIDEMLVVSGEMVEAALACLLDNEPLTVDLSERDRSVNENEQLVRRLVLEHLTIDPKRDQILSLILISAVQEAERLGDLGKSLAQASTLADKPRLSPHAEPLRALRDRILRLFADAREGFVEEGATAAQRLEDEHRDIKTVVAEYLEAIAHADDISSNEAVVYGISARMMGRVVSHLANIVSATLVPFDQLRRSGQA